MFFYHKEYKVEETRILFITSFIFKFTDLKINLRKFKITKLLNNH